MTAYINEFKFVNAAMSASMSRAFSHILYRNGGECMECPKYVTTGNSSFCPVKTKSLN